MMAATRMTTLDVLHYDRTDEAAIMAALSAAIVCHAMLLATIDIRRSEYAMMLFGY